MLGFKDVTFSYPQDKGDVIEKLSFNINKGEFVSIIGPSGCGKSTIFRLINGLEKDFSGSITINGEDIRTLSNYSAFMPQKDLLFPWNTIKKNILLPMELAKVNKDERERRCNEVLNQIGLSEYADKLPCELSGGMRQRVSFARTLVSGADMLLLDEPFSALDYFTKLNMQEWLLEQWQQLGKTIIFITHDVEEAIFLSQSIYVINDMPFSTMQKIDIPLSYPRSRDDLGKSEIISLRESLIQGLRRSNNI